jgi:hypothetical protein
MIESKPKVLIASKIKKRKRGNGGCDLADSKAETKQENAYKKLKAHVETDLEVSVNMEKKLNEFDLKLQEINDEIFFMHMDLFFEGMFK